MSKLIILLMILNLFKNNTECLIDVSIISLEISKIVVKYNNNEEINIPNETDSLLSKLRNVTMKCFNYEFDDKIVDKCLFNIKNLANPISNLISVLINNTFNFDLILKDWNLLKISLQKTKNVCSGKDNII